MKINSTVVITTIVMAALIAISWRLGTAVDSYLHKPVVYRSWSTKKIINVKNRDGSPWIKPGVPELYHLVWVK